MSKREIANASADRKKLAEHLTGLITSEKCFKPREAVHRGPMEYRPKKPISVQHMPRDPIDDKVDVIPTVNWKQGFRFIDLFAGIGGMRLGFQSVGGKCVFSSEWDPLAQETYAANFGERPHGDITQIDPASVPGHDILLAGFPCQAFSIIGNRKGFADTRGTLFFNVEQILREKRPPVFLLENVKQFRTHDGGRTYNTVIESLSLLGYITHTTILNALYYGVPQKRERTFIVGFRQDVPFQFPEPLTSPPNLGAVLVDDDTVDPKLFCSPLIKAKRLKRLEAQGQKPFYPSMWHENKGGHLGVHQFSCALRHNASYNYLLVNGYRRPSSRECLRLQGFPESFKIVVKHSAIRAQAGNSVAVPVIAAIASQMVNALAASTGGGSVQSRHQLDLFTDKRQDTRPAFA